MSLCGSTTCAASSTLRGAGFSWTRCSDTTEPIRPRRYSTIALGSGVRRPRCRSRRMCSTRSRRRFSATAPRPASDSGRFAGAGPPSCCGRAGRPSRSSASSIRTRGSSPRACSLRASPGLVATSSSSGTSTRTGRDTRATDTAGPRSARSRTSSCARPIAPARSRAGTRDASICLSPACQRAPDASRRRRIGARSSSNRDR